MKRNAVATMIKDILFAVIAWGIAAFFINALWGSMGSGAIGAKEAKGVALFFAGIPFGWRWASKIITAMTMKGVFIKLSIAFFLGWFAIFVVLIGDVIFFVSYLIKKNAKKKQTAARTVRTSENTSRRYAEGSR